MTERSRNILVGLTAIVGLAGLGYLIFIFGEVPGWVKDNYEITFPLDRANGLADGSRINLNGIDIGYVDRIVLQDDPRKGVKVIGVIRAEVAVPSGADAVASVGPLGGGATLSIQTEPAEADEPIEYLAKDGSAVVEGRATSLGEQIRSEFREQLSRFADAADKVVDVAGDVQQFVNEYREIGRRVNGLLERSDPADIEAGRVQPNIYTLIVRADQRLKELAPVVRGFREIVGDEQFRADIRAAAANARSMTATVDEEVKTLSADIREKLDTLSRRYVAVADDISATLQELEGALAAARQGEGTLGKLLDDPALYNSLEDAADRLSDALTEFQLLIEKWKAEGLPVQF